MPSDTELAVYTLDNLRVNSYVEYNLTASNISAPAAADVDKPFEITATVSNTGDNTIRSFGATTSPSTTWTARRSSLRSSRK